jgi:hypothetical protein
LWDATSRLRRKNMLNGLCLTVKYADGTMQTRYIIGSKNDATDTDIIVKIHYPFGHPPSSHDKFWVHKQSLVNTAPVRLNKFTELPHDLGGTFISDPVLGAQSYRDSGRVSIATGTGIVTTKDTTDSANIIKHYLAPNDKIRLKNCSTESFDGVHTVVVTSPTTFTSTTIPTGTDVTGDWEVLEESNSSVSNPINISITNPMIVASFGGLDMRKTKTYTTSGTDYDGDAGGATNSQLRVTSTGHLLSAGDVVTANGARAEHDGTYIISDVLTNNFDVENSDTTDNTTTSTVYTNQFELLVAGSAADGAIGELRAGLNNWDRGDIAGNIIRHDSTASIDKYMQFGDAVITVSPSSLADQDGDFFLKNNRYYYKLSFIYDGYQEGPLSDSNWSYEDTVSVDKLSITIKLTDYSRRLTHVVLYRKDDFFDFYKLVKEIRTDSGWNNIDGVYSYTLKDEGPLQASYESRTGMSEVLDSIKIRYGMAAEIDGYLFVGDCSQERVKNAHNMIFRSRPGMFSIFNYVSDFLTLKSKPTALVNFNGRIYAFDKSNIYRINQANLEIEDISEGIGCISKDSIIVTEHGMFFADKKGAYMHNGQQPIQISLPIQKGGDTEETFGGTDNIKDVSWKNVVTDAKEAYPYVIYDASISSILFNVEYSDVKSSTTDGENVIYIKRQYIWSYNIFSKRWDLWELSNDSSIGKPFLGENGEILIPIDGAIYHNRGGTSKRDYTWVSKKLTMNEDSLTKVFNKIKLNGTTRNVNLGSTSSNTTTGMEHAYSSDKLHLITSTGDIDASKITSSKPSTGYFEYKLKGANRKGRWIQCKLENMTEPLDSLGVIFRKKMTK